MLIKRKTTSLTKTARGRATFYADSSTILHGGATAPADAPGALLAEIHRVMHVPTAERRICPEVMIVLPGIGEVVLSPAEVAAIETAIDVARKQATRGDNFNGRELSRSF